MRMRFSVNTRFSLHIRYAMWLFACIICARMQTEANSTEIQRRRPPGSLPGDAEVSATRIATKAPAVSPNLPTDHANRTHSDTVGFEVGPQTSAPPNPPDAVLINSSVSAAAAFKGPTQSVVTTGIYRVEPPNGPFAGSGDMNVSSGGVFGGNVHTDESLGGNFSTFPLIDKDAPLCRNGSSVPGRVNGEEIRGARLEWKVLEKFQADLTVAVQDILQQTDAAAALQTIAEVEVVARIKAPPPLSEPAPAAAGSSSRQTFQRLLRVEEPLEFTAGNGDVAAVEKDEVDGGVIVVGAADGTPPPDTVTVFLNSSLVLNFERMYPVEMWRTHGFFTRDYLLLINPHWLQFPPAMHVVYYGLAAIYAAIFVVGCFGNFLVIFMFVRCRSLRTPANTLVINLAVSDFCLLAKCPVFIFNSIYLGPALGSVGCELYGFVGGLTGTVSIVTLAAISVDRYYVVVYPLDPNKRITGSRSKFCVFFTWVYGTVFSALPLFNVGVGHYIPEGLLTSCSFDYLSPERGVKTFILVFFGAAWVLPFLVIVFCYINILRVVCEAQKLARNQTGSISSRHCKDEEKRRTEIKLAGVVIMVILLWFVAWTPYAVVALLGVADQRHLITPLSSMIPAIFCKVASCIDPFIYAVTHPRFRTEIRNMVLRISGRRRTGTQRHFSMSKSTEGGGVLTRANSPQRFPSESVRSDSSEHYVEEIMVMVDLPQKKTADGQSPDTDEVVVGAEAMAEAGAHKPPSWFVKPSFAQRSVSIKSISRQFSVKKDPMST